MLTFKLKVKKAKWPATKWIFRKHSQFYLCHHRTVTVPFVCTPEDCFLAFDDLKNKVLCDSTTTRLMWGLPTS